MVYHMSSVYVSNYSALWWVIWCWVRWIILANLWAMQTWTGRSSDLSGLAVCQSILRLPAYNAPNAVMQWRGISKMFWRLQMGFMSENHPFCCFRRWKCSIFTHREKGKEKKNSRRKKKVRKKKTVRCFKCKNCIMWLLVISVVPLWMKILIRWFCTLKIFHLIYNL